MKKILCLATLTTFIIFYPPGAKATTIGFDPMILAFDGALFGTYLLGDPDDFGETMTDIPSPGGLRPDGSIVPDNSVNIFELSFLLDFELDALQPSSFALATLTFDTLNSKSWHELLRYNRHLYLADDTAWRSTFCCGTKREYYNCICACDYITSRSWIAKAWCFEQERGYSRRISAQRRTGR